MLKYVWTLSLRNFSAAISSLLAVLRISKLKLMETETDKQTLTFVKYEWLPFSKINFSEAV